jgi:hypothetical protein
LRIRHHDEPNLNDPIRSLIDSIFKAGVQFPTAAKSDGVAVGRFSCRKGTP